MRQEARPRVLAVRSTATARRRDVAAREHGADRVRCRDRRVVRAHPPFHSSGSACCRCRRDGETADSLGSPVRRGYSRTGITELNDGRTPRTVRVRATTSVRRGRAHRYPGRGGIIPQRRIMRTAEVAARRQLNRAEIVPLRLAGGRRPPAHPLGRAPRSAGCHCALRLNEHTSVRRYPVVLHASPTST